MIDGVAKTSESGIPVGNASEVISLSRLSSATTPDADIPSASLAETGSVLLHVTKTAAFVCGGDDDARLICCVGIETSNHLVDLAREIARVANAISEPVFLQNLSSRSSELARRLSAYGVESLACMPETLDGSATGIFVAMSEEARTFSNPDVEILRILAAQAVMEADIHGSNNSDDVPISDHDVLIDLAHRKIKELTALNRVSEAVSSTLDMEKLLEIVLEHGMAAVSADAGSLMLVNQENNKLEIVAARGISDKLVEEISQPIGQSIAGYVAKNGISVLVSDARRDDRFEMPAFRDEINSSASVPLKNRGQVIGVLNVNTTKSNHFFDERDLQLLETVANQMAVAIENSRLHARVTRRTSQLDSLLQISKTITSTLNLDEVLRRLSDEMCSLFAMDVCVILLVDSIRGRFRYGYGSGLKSKNRHTYLDVALPLASRVKHTGHRTMHADISGHRTLSTAISIQEGLKGAVSIPLRHAGKLVAVATAFSRSVSVFPQSVKDIAKSLPELAGVAIHNAGVYGRKYRIAEMVQSRLVPQGVQVGDRAEVGTKFVPAREVGGDYCDFIHYDEHKFVVVLGDVSGNDVEAAEYTLMGKHVIRAYTKGCDAPCDVLCKANAHIYEDTNPEVFISVFYGNLDLQEMTVRFGNAGCEPAILYRSTTNEAFTLNSDGIVLGIIPNAQFQEKEMKLISGDVMVMVTDGITEAGTTQERFGIGRVGEALAASSSMPAQNIADYIYESVMEWVDGPIHDDIGIVVIKIA